jgi:hypothetical protein
MCQFIFKAPSLGLTSGTFRQVLLLQRGQIGVINHRLQNLVFSQVGLVRAMDIHFKSS